MSKDFFKGLFMGVGITLLTTIMIFLVINFSIRKIMLNSAENTKSVSYGVNSGGDIIKKEDKQIQRSPVDDFAERYKAAENEIRLIKEEMKRR